MILGWGEARIIFEPCNNAHGRLNDVGNRSLGGEPQADQLQERVP